MINILFKRSEKAFLPEIDAYVNYFNEFNDFSAFDSSKIDKDFSIDDFDIIWEFKGYGGLKRKDKIIIHEYASLSVGAFPKVKNTIKAKVNFQPNLRIFLNSDIKKEFNFNDDIEYCIRDMGISKSFIEDKSSKKDYDFIYVGSISKERRIDLLLNKFGENPPGKLCLVGNIDDDLYKQYKGNKDIIFTGKVSYNDVPSIASKAIYGINFIPDKYPYNLQTSTKLLEYLSLGLKIVTTDYQWIRRFEYNHGCSFYKLDTNITNLDIKSLENHEFKSNFDPQDFLWDSIIEKSNVKGKIENLFK